jgi:hypothetical protein
MIVCVPVTVDGLVAPRWGRARRVAVAVVDGDRIIDWREAEVAWDVLHDEGTEGAHHARVASDHPPAEMTGREPVAVAQVQVMTMTSEMAPDGRRRKAPAVRGAYAVGRRRWSGDRSELLAGSWSCRPTEWCSTWAPGSG